MKKLFLIIAGAFCLLSNMQAQDSVNNIENLTKKDLARSKYKNAVMLLPQYTAINGMRVDFEFRTGNNAIVIGPAFYADDSNYNIFYSEYQSMVGGGIDFTYKLNLTNANKCVVPYGALDLSYSMKVITTRVEEYYYNGYDEYYYNEYYYGGYSLPLESTYVEETKNIAIHKVGVSALIGIQITPIPRFVIDVSAGIGGKYSFSNKEKDYVKNNYSYNITSLAYSGIVPACNLKLGIKF